MSAALTLALLMLAPAAGGALGLHLWQTRKPSKRPRPPMAIYRHKTGGAA